MAAALGDASAPHKASAPSAPGSAPAPGTANDGNGTTIHCAPPPVLAETQGTLVVVRGAAVNSGPVEIATQKWRGHSIILSAGTPAPGAGSVLKATSAAVWREGRSLKWLILLVALACVSVMFLTNVDSQGADATEQFAAVDVDPVLVFADAPNRATAAMDRALRTDAPGLLFDRLVEVDDRLASAYSRSVCLKAGGAALFALALATVRG